MPDEKRKVVVIAHNIRSVFNVGALFRTCDAAGVSEIILGGYTPDPTHHKMSKTALGAEQVVPWRKLRHTWKEIERLKADGYQIIALETGRKTENIMSCEIHYPCVIVLGNEVTGLSKAMLARCQRTVSIPMRGIKKSLNVSVAAGIAIYKFLN